MAKKGDQVFEIVDRRVLIVQFCNLELWILVTMVLLLQNC